MISDAYIDTHSKLSPGGTRAFLIFFWWHLKTFIYLFILAVLHGLQDLSSPTRD